MGELDIGDADAQALFLCGRVLGRRRHSVFQLDEALGRHRVQQLVLVLEMVIGRGRADAGFTRHGPQRQGVWPLTLKHRLGGMQQSAAKITVMIGFGFGERRSRHVSIPQTATFLTFNPNGVKIDLDIVQFDAI